MRNFSQQIGGTNLLLFSIIFAFFGLHLAYINTPFVNYEWAYRIGSQYFLTHDSELLEQYFLNQANPLTYSLFSSIIVNIFGDHFASYRILALLGGIIVLFSLSKYKEPYLLLIVGLNPLIWIYSGRAYSELLSVGIMLLAINFQKLGVLSGFFAGLSASIKYHSIVMYGSYLFISWIKEQIIEKKINFKDVRLISASLSLILLIAFIVINQYLFDVFVVPDTMNIVLEIKAQNVIINFYSYAFYLAGMFIFTLPFAIKNSNKYMLIIIAIISMLLEFFWKDYGEMGFGSFNLLLNNEVIHLLHITGFINFIFCIFTFFHDKNSRKMLLTVIVFLLIMSLFRPVSRYLIFVIPFWGIMIFKNFRINKTVLLPFILICIVLNSYAVFYQIRTASASLEIATWIKTNNYQTGYGVIYPHVGVLYNYEPDSNITVIDNIENIRKTDKVIYRKYIDLFGFNIKNYYVLQHDKL